MGQETVTFDGNQDKGNAWALIKVNDERAKQDPPLSSLTISEFVQDFNERVANSYYNQSQEGVVVGVKEAFEKADAGKQEQVKDILGVGDVVEEVVL